MAAPFLLRGKLMPATGERPEISPEEEAALREQIQDAQDLLFEGDNLLEGLDSQIAGLAQMLADSGLQELAEGFASLIPPRFRSIGEALVSVGGFAAALQEILEAPSFSEGPSNINNVFGDAAELNAFVGGILTATGGALTFGGLLAGNPIVASFGFSVASIGAIFDVAAFALQALQAAINAAFPPNDVHREQPDEDPPVSPLVIDLDGDGVEVTPLGELNNTFFDLDADGFAERTAFVSADDGLLALDRNNNGTIDDITEVFGNLEQDGFSELAELDVNGDGFIDSNDAIFDDLRIFQDVNGDAISQENELSSLADNNIVSIDLNAQSIDETNAGNPVLFRSSVTFSDGSQSDIDDVFFNNLQSETRLVTPVEVPPEIALLPDFLGGGQFADPPPMNRSI